MNTNGDIMMPMMQLGISVMNVFNNHDNDDETMMKMFNMTIRTDMIISIMMLTMTMVLNMMTMTMTTVLNILMF